MENASGETSAVTCLNSTVEQNRDIHTDQHDQTPANTHSRYSRDVVTPRPYLLPGLLFINIRISRSISSAKYRHDSTFSASVALFRTDVNLFTEIRRQRESSAPIRSQIGDRLAELFSPSSERKKRRTTFLFSSCPRSRDIDIESSRGR